MSRLGDLPEVLPIFPLEGALLLPRGRLPLHIFEPRYLAMIEDCMKTPQRLIGMIQPNPRGLELIGCAGRLSAFAETDDGRYMITLTGISRFRLGAEVESQTPYRCFTADWASFTTDQGSPETDPRFDRPAFLSLLRRFFTARGLATEWGALDSAEDESLINTLSMLCPFSPQDKQALLEAPTLALRRETLMTLIEFALRVGPQEPTQ